MDISSDLTEFSKSPIAVVCAGAKSILDIPRTLEYLETQVLCLLKINQRSKQRFTLRTCSKKAKFAAESKWIFMSANIAIVLDLKISLK